MTEKHTQDKEVGSVETSLYLLADTLYLIKPHIIAHDESHH